MRNYTYICNVFIVYTNMIIGIIYKYTSPSGKCYIGQTINEPLRRKMWFSSSYHYAGVKIDRARKKYGKDNFVYQILVKNIYSSRELAIQDLNRLEIYYIGLYDSYNNGYNSTIGGDGVVGLKLTEEQIEKVRKANLGKKLSKEHRIKIGRASSKWQNTEEGKIKMSSIRKGKSNPNAIRVMVSARIRPIVQLSIDMEFIREFNNIKEAVTSIGGKTANANIIKVCKGERATAYGYIWKYKEDLL